MYEIEVEDEFCAAHALTIGGAVEPLHGHNWRVRVVIAGETLDGDGLLCDFHTVGSVLSEILGRMNNGHLNELPPFDRINPSAEAVARYIGEELSSRLDGSLAPHAWVSSVRVTEAAGCAATYRRAGGWAPKP